MSRPQSELAERTEPSPGSGSPAWLDGWRLLYALVLVLLFSTVSSQEPLATNSHRAPYAAAALLAAWTHYRHRGEARELHALSTPLRVLLRGLWLLGAISALSTFWSEDPWITAQKSLALLILVAIIHNLAVRRWTDVGRMPADMTVAFAFLVTTFTASLVAEYVGLPDTRDYEHEGRFQGLYSNPNILAMMCLAAIPLGWGLYRQTKNELYGVALFPAVVALLMSQSRTAIVAVSVGALWIAFRAKPRMTTWAVALLGGAILIGVVGAGASLPLTDPPFSRFSSRAGGDLLGGRTFIWQEAIRLWQAQPFLGYGYATGVNNLGGLHATGWSAFRFHHAHNSYLQLLLELGVVGMIPLLVIVAASLWAAARGRLDGIGIGLAWLVLSGLLLQITETAMFNQPFQFVFWPAVAGVLVWTAEPDPAELHPPESAAHAPLRPEKNL